MCSNFAVAQRTPLPAPEVEGALTRSQQARRRRVIEAAVELAAEGGYDAVQMRDVAIRGRVAMGRVLGITATAEPPDLGDPVAAEPPDLGDAVDPPSATTGLLWVLRRPVVDDADD